MLRKIYVFHNVYTYQAIGMQYYSPSSRILIYTYIDYYKESVINKYWINQDYGK